MKNLSSTLAVQVLMLLLTGCRESVISNPTSSQSSSTSVPSSSSTEITVTPSASPSPTPSPSPSTVTSYGPCDTSVIPAKSGQLKFASFSVNTSPIYSSQIRLESDCTWAASWEDHARYGGTSAYKASGTFKIEGSVITFFTEQVPAGISYTITTAPYRPNDPVYVLSLKNPSVLSSFYNASTLASGTAKTGLGFQDWILNKYLQDIGCKSSLSAFNTCLSNNYSSSNLSGIKHEFYQD